MSYTERRSLFGLLYTLGFMIAYFQIMNRQDIQSLSLQSWGQWFLVMFLALVIGRVVMTVVHVVVESVVIAIHAKKKAELNAELSSDEKSKRIRSEIESSINDDERSKLIDIKSTYHIGTFLFLGFIGGVIFLAFNQPIYLFFVSMYIGIALAGLSYDGLSLYYHRKTS